MYVLPMCTVFGWTTVTKTYGPQSLHIYYLALCREFADPFYKLAYQMCPVAKKSMNVDAKTI